MKGKQGLTYVRIRPTFLITARVGVLKHQPSEYPSAISPNEIPRNR